jgi:hypothetical protein
MRSGRLLFRLPLWAGVVVSLGLSYATSPAQDMPPLPAAPAAPSPAPPQTVAQSTPPAAPANPPAAAEPPAQAPAVPAGPALTQAELGQLLAPIALYPDQLLSQILMASTYPVEVVEAARWVAEPAHRALRGGALADALRDQHWDPSVMALVPFPQVLEQMSAQIEWTQKLGAAFVAQQADVMNEVQQLRQQAIAAGNFKSGPQCQCVVAQSGGFVSVAPANPQVVYAPVYAPAIYGPWQYAAYPPFLFPLPVGFAFAPGSFIGFGWGVNVGYYGPLWGWASLNWGGHNIIVDPGRYGAVSGGHAAFAGGVWAHDSARGAGIASGRAAGTSGWSGRAAGTSGWSGRAAGTSGWSGHAAGNGGWSGHAAWSGGRSAPIGHAAWAGGRAGRFMAAAPAHPIRGGRGPVHMAAGGGVGHGGAAFHAGGGGHGGAHGDHR